MLKEVHQRKKTVIILYSAKCSSSQVKEGEETARRNQRCGNRQGVYMCLPGKDNRNGIKGKGREHDIIIFTDRIIYKDKLNKKV